VNNAGQQESPAVAALSTGGFVVTWTSPDGNGRGVYGRLYDASGAPVSGDLPITAQAHHEYGSSVVALPDGGFVAIWESQGGVNGASVEVFGQRFDGAGNAVGARFLVPIDFGLDERTSSYLQGGSSITVLDDGRLAITWTHEGQGFPGVYVRLFDVPAATASGTEDQPHELPGISVSLNDIDGSETLSVTLSGYPDGATFSVGHPDGAQWVIDTPSDIQNLATTPLVMTPPADFNGTFTLTVDATATDTATLSSGVATDTATTSTSFDVTIAAVNDAPVITQLAGPSASEPILVAENTAGSFLTITATDPEDQDLTYSIGANPDGSFDNGAFTIDSATGALRFAAPPDFEFTDPGNDDLYKVRVTVADTEGATSTRDYFVAVTDVAENGLGDGVFKAAYLTGNDPWGVSPADPGSPDAAMNDAFGAGQWSKFNNSYSDAVFDTYDFVYLDGGDGATGWFQGFINANRTAMEEFVSQGGTLFINAGRWSGQDNFNLGFGADLDDNEVSATGVAVNAAHVIFNGPNGSAGTSWSGNYFSHDTVDGGPGLVALINGQSGTVLAELSYGDGHVLFGGITSSYFHDPDQQANILRANMLSYTASFASDYVV
jgi:hypothetical protein